jgi:hypothetical protein
VMLSINLDLTFSILTRKRIGTPPGVGRQLSSTIKGNSAEKALPALKIFHNRWLQQPLGISVYYFNDWINPGMGSAPFNARKGTCERCSLSSLIGFLWLTEFSGSLEKALRGTNFLNTFQRSLPMVPTVSDTLRNSRAVWLSNLFQKMPVSSTGRENTIR